MAITGTHVLLYTSKADELRAVLRDAFNWQHVDAGEGWLIFRLPPSELGVHPTEDGKAPMHQFTLMCDDIRATLADLRAKGVSAAREPEDQSWGITATLNLPGDLEIMLYQPRHPVAI